MPLTNEAFARQLLQLRESQLLNRDEAAKQAGVSERQWQRWENAESIPHSSNLQKILDAFDLDPAYFGIEETPVSNQLLERINAKLDAIIAHLGIQLPAEDELVPGPPPGDLQQALQDDAPNPRSRRRKGATAPA